MFGSVCWLHAGMGVEVSEGRQTVTLMLRTFDTNLLTAVATSGGGACASTSMLYHNTQDSKLPPKALYTANSSAVAATIGSQLPRHPPQLI